MLTTRVPTGAPVVTLVTVRVGAVVTVRVGALVTVRVGAVVTVRVGAVETWRVRVMVPPLLAVVVAVGLDARTFVLVRPWSFPEAAMSDPVNNAPVTTLTSMRFVFISL